MNKSILDVLNVKATEVKTTKSVGKVSIEKQINNLFAKACINAIKEDKKLKQYFIEDAPKQQCFVQKLNKKTKEQYIELEDVEGALIVIPSDEVELVNGTNKAKLDKAFKVGTIRTYIDGIKQTYIEYLKEK